MVNAKHGQRPPLYIIENDDYNNINSSHRHYNEILKQSSSSSENEIVLPTPKGLTEKFIYWLHHRKKSVKPSGYWRYVLDVYKNLFLTFYFNWTMIFTAPLSSIAFILVYPTAGFLLFAFEIGLKVFMDYLGGEKLMKKWSDRYANGFGIINWGAPYMLLSQQTAELVKSVLPSLAEPIHLQKGTARRQRTFDISIAQAMTALSALIYERHDAKVTEAYRTLSKQNSEDPDVIENAKYLIWESERPIRKIAKTFHLSFSGITELKSLGGPFCGIYWSETHPFIIVTFKGTTPTNYSEFLVDATLQRTDARSFLFGSVHQGFYDSLFPKGDDEWDPYFSIQSTILEKAEYLQQKLGTSQPIQVWIAGHSLGSALGCLLFSRWLKSAEDLSPLCELRDAYFIGTPAVGDNNFASCFSSYSNTPSTRASTMWRVVNKSDLFCRLPPGYNSPTVGHYMPATDFFNYSHVGHAVQITYPILHQNPLKSHPSNYQPNLEVNIIPGAWKGNIDFSQDSNKPMNPIQKLEAFYPFFIKDHIPINYFKGLERARKHYMYKQDVSQI